jgi:hypothetical protein
MAVAVDLAPKDKVADFMQAMMFLCFSSQLLSLAIALPIVDWLGDHRGHLSFMAGSVIFYQV